LHILQLSGFSLRANTGAAAAFAVAALQLEVDMGTRTIDTGTEHLLACIDDGVAIITLNRPERRNAFTTPMMAALGQTLRAAEVDPSVGCVVLTGAGGAFCAGGDVKAMAAGGEQTTAAAPLSYQDRILLQQVNQRETAGRLYEMPKPTIAALPGAAAGAGLALALACDLRVAAESAILTTAFAKVGLAGDYGGSWFLTRLVGPGRAKELYWFSEKLSARDAERLGLVNRVVPDAELTAQTMALARRLVAGPRVAYGLMKQNVNRAIDASLADCLDLEVAHHFHTATTRDHAEAAAAFVEKREPRFQGR
jgi:2-(1,2-epoxy-1,2-dihydrophenyl)acetyl-CoA isomerase